VKVIQTEDGRYAIQTPNGVTSTRRYYTQAFAEAIAACVAEKLGVPVQTA
jgi:hypothetical protein